MLKPIECSAFIRFVDRPSGVATGMHNSSVFHYSPSTERMLDWIMIIFSIFWRDGLVADATFAPVSAVDQLLFGLVEQTLGI